MHRHRLLSTLRLAIAPLMAILITLTLAVAAQAAPGRERASQRPAAASGSRRANSREAIALAGARTKAVDRARVEARTKAQAEARAELKHARRTRREGKAFRIDRRPTFKVKLVKTTVRTKTTTTPATAANPVSTTVITTTATVTAAATPVISGVTGTVTSTATATSTAAATVTSTDPSTSSTSSTSSPAASGGPVSSVPTNPNEPLGIPGAWSMVMDSEFNSSTLNTNIWTPGWFGTGITQPVNGLEDDCYSSSNVVMTGSELDLNLTNTPSSCAGKNFPYTGALISSNPNGTNQGFLYTYGVVQAEVYVPAATTGKIANWPAVWAVTPPSETYGEDDVFEGLVGSACYHYINDSGNPGNCDWTMSPGWHTFASDWQPGSITYYYDGTEVGSEASATNEPMYIILDNTVDRTNTQMADPGSMQVKYVRVWQGSQSVQNAG